MTLSSQFGGMPDRIGRFLLMRRLAVGGMAELFLARVRGLEGFEKVVVLKRILPHLAEDQDFVQMFLTEARLAATLDHPNVVHVHDIGREDGEYFFTMEYLHGEDLRALLAALRKQGKRLPLRHALSIITEVAAGLHFAHEQVGFDGRPLGIVHRDVSPSNVLVTFAGGVKVVDFGIAKAAGPTHASRLTGLKGKAAYMSPEQCKARAIDRRSDVFAIGLLLFELVTGAPAFVAGNDLAILHRVARADVPDPKVVWPECPDGLRAIIQRAVAAEPDDRYPTAETLQMDIESFAHEARVPLSNGALGRFMHEVFGERLLPWLEGEPRAKLQIASPREATPATRAKAMRRPVRPEASIDQTVITGPPPPEQTAIAPVRRATVPAGDQQLATAARAVASASVLGPDMRTEKVRRRAVVIAPAEIRPVRRTSPWVWGGVAIVGIAVAGWAVARSDRPAAEHGGPPAVIAPAASAEEVPEVTPAAALPDAAVAVETVPAPAVDADAQAPTPAEVADVDAVPAEPDLAEIAAGSERPPSAGTKRKAKDRRRSRGAASKPSPSKPSPSKPSPSKPSPSKPSPSKPSPSQDSRRSEPDAKAPASPGPKHSRPDLPANRDPNGLLPY